MCPTTVIVIPFKTPYCIVRNFIFELTQEMKGFLEILKYTRQNYWNYYRKVYCVLVSNNEYMTVDVIIFLNSTVFL